MSEDRPTRPGPMPNAALESAVRQIRRTTGRGRPSELTDRELLRQFAQSRDQDSFSQLVARHGPAVLGVCLRVLKHRQDAEDAFQATFLVLARKAGQIGWRDSIAYWLYEVAFRTAQKARGSRFKRLNRERADMPEPATVEPNPGEGSNEWIDAEIRRLPRPYAEAVVLCCLQEHSTVEAARVLGVSEGSLRARLYRGREMLRERLAARGVVLPATLSAAVSTTLITQTCTAAVTFANGLAVGSAATLADGVLKAMTLSKLKMWTSAILAMGITIGSGAALIRVQAETPGNPPASVRSDPDRQQPPLPEADEPALATEADKAADPFQVDGKHKGEGKVVAVDPTRKTLLIKTEIDDQDREVTFAVEPAAFIEVAREKTTLETIKPGMWITFVMTDDRSGILAARARWSHFGAKIKAIDLAKETVTVEVEANGERFEIPFPVRKGSAIELDRFPSGLADLEVGQEYRFEWAVDKKSFVAIEGRSPKGDVHGRVKLAEAGKPLLVSLVVAMNDDERRVDLAFEMSPSVRVRLAGKDATLAELQPRMPVRLRLAEDRRTVTAIWAAPATDRPDRDEE